MAQGNGSPLKQHKESKDGYIAGGLVSIGGACVVYRLTDVKPFMVSSRELPSAGAIMIYFAGSLLPSRMWAMLL